MAYSPYEIMEVYGIEAKEDGIAHYGNGHINDTYLVHAKDGERYILQRINTNVFRDPVMLMNNIVAVTEYIKENSDNPHKLVVIPTKSGERMACVDGNCFRLYNFIDAISHDFDPTPEYKLIYNAGNAFGIFQNSLDSFDASVLGETIPNFHNTKKRYADFEEAIAANASGRRDQAMPEIECARSFEKYVSTIVDGIADKSIPLRVTHNDTKLNNVLFDRDTNECVCVIDLDTVMPGSLLYDFGDALRFCASSSAEDETDLSKVYFDVKKYESFASGFLSALHEKLTDREKELLPFSAMLLTYECGIRFLGDFVNGDTYFKVKHPTHNLDRARNQLALAKDIEAKLPELEKLTRDILAKLK